MRLDFFRCYGRFNHSCTFFKRVYHNDYAFTYQLRYIKGMFISTFKKSNFDVKILYIAKQIEKYIFLETKIVI